MPYAVMRLVRALVRRLGGDRLPRLTQVQRIVLIFLPGMLATVTLTILLMSLDLPDWLMVIIGGLPLAAAFALLDAQDRLQPKPHPTRPARRRTYLDAEGRVLRSETIDPSRTPDRRPDGKSAR